jgi:hypothetical protein
MFRMFPAVIGIGAVLATGAVHGTWTDRWGAPEEPAAWAARMDAIPLTTDDWEGEEVASKRTEYDGFAGHIYRRYVNRRTGKEVKLYLVCGKPGPVSVHTPDVCYGAVGYKVLARGKFTSPADGAVPAAELETGLFRQERAAEQNYLRIFWAWSTGGAWSAPAEPRRAFAGNPALYKIYLLHDMASPDEAAEEDPCSDLLKQLLPGMEHALRNPS